jgi:hypothetical protein
MSHPHGTVSAPVQSDSKAIYPLQVRVQVCLPMVHLHLRRYAFSSNQRTLRRFTTVPVRAYWTWALSVRLSAHAATQIENRPCDGSRSGIAGHLGASGRTTVDFQEQNALLKLNRDGFITDAVPMHVNPAMHPILYLQNCDYVESGKCRHNPRGHWQVCLNSAR